MRLLLLGGTGQVGTELRALAPANRCRGCGARSRRTRSSRRVSNRKDCFDGAVGRRHQRGRLYRRRSRRKRSDSHASRSTRRRRRGWRPRPGGAGSRSFTFRPTMCLMGKKGRPMSSSDEAAPLNVYGSSKLAGELGVRAANPRHVILRTSWVYSPYRQELRQDNSCALRPSASG